MNVRFKLLLLCFIVYEICINIFRLREYMYLQKSTTKFLETKQMFDQNHFGELNLTVANTSEKTPEELNVTFTSTSEETSDTKFNKNPNNTYFICTYGVFNHNPAGKRSKFDPHTDANDNKFKKCPGYNQCRFTPDHVKADVIMVEAMAFDWSIIRPNLPSLEGQLWILYTWEPPHIMKTLPWDRLERQYHLTATYQRTSDIYSPYGRYEKRAEPHGPAPNITKLVESKTRLVAWFVSNCGGQSQRRRYVDELQKYIPVDIYGKCGNLTCSKLNGGDCSQLLTREYKFYLSFENSICMDYITEKTWIRLGNIVPVVLGGANYTEALPPHSFIDVRDFSSAKALGEYLLMLDQRPELYLEYYSWMKDYVSHYQENWPCDVCKYLHTHAITRTELHNPRVRLYDITNVTHACEHPDEFYAKHL